MSSNPSGWATPKKNWSSADIVSSTDLNRVEGNIDALDNGARTLDPAQAPTGNSGSLRQILSWLANRIKAIMGTANWWDAPPVTLKATKEHIGAGGTAHAAATTATAGFMSAADKDKLDKISSGAQQVAIISGTISHGDTIPLPSGYSEAQCVWMAYIADTTGAAWSSHDWGLCGFKCTLSGRKVSIVQTLVDVHTGLRTTSSGGTANYMVIGVK